MRKAYQNKAWLKRKYVDQNMTTQEIADICGVTHATIYNWLKKFDLIRESRKWSR
jgi:transposase